MEEAKLKCEKCGSVFEAEKLYNIDNHIYSKNCK